MKFFKAEDFYEVSGFWSREDLAKICNYKIEREAKRVYLNPKNSLNGQGDIELTNSGQSHQALLINIEPLEKCQHPKEKVNLVKQYLTRGLVLGEKTTECIGSGYLCECGYRVEPNSFVEIKE